MRNGRTLTWLVAVAGLSVVLAAAAGAAPPKDAFTGTWTVTVTPADGGGKPYEDKLTFAGQKLTSATFKARGFADAEVETDTRGGQIATFTATAKSPKQGSAKWGGTVSAGQVQGTLTWTKADGTAVEYTYTGGRK
jgi:hypothetical protein